jgi:hypothetical protein
VSEQDNNPNRLRQDNPPQHRSSHETQIVAMEAERPLSFFRNQQDAFALMSELRRESVATSTTDAPQADFDFAAACDQGMTPTPAVCWRNVDPDRARIRRPRP